MQFAAQVSGAGNTAVTWSMTPAMGTLSEAGLYTAPASNTATQAGTVTATSVADSTKSAAANITLLPAGQFSVSYTLIGSSSVQVSWTAPSGRPAGDWIGLSSVGAPGYWYTWSQNTGGAATGSVVLTLPASPGIWVFRYYLGITYTNRRRQRAACSGCLRLQCHRLAGHGRRARSLSTGLLPPGGQPATPSSCSEWE